MERDTQGWMDGAQTAYDNERIASDRLKKTLSEQWQEQERERRRSFMQQQFGDIEPTWDYDEYPLTALPGLLRECPPYEEIIQRSPQECFDLHISVYERRGDTPSEWEPIKYAIPNKVAFIEVPAHDRRRGTELRLVWLWDRRIPLEEWRYQA